MIDTYFEGIRGGAICMPYSSSGHSRQISNQSPGVSFENCCEHAFQRSMTCFRSHNKDNHWPSLSSLSKYSPPTSRSNHPFHPPFFHLELQGPSPLATQDTLTLPHTDPGHHGMQYHQCIYLSFFSHLINMAVVCLSGTTRACLGCSAGFKKCTFYEIF